MMRAEFCGWIPEVIERIVEIQPEDLKLREVDFGGRESDRTNVVTIGQQSYTKTY